MIKQTINRFSAEFLSRFSEAVIQQLILIINLKYKLI